MREFDAGDSEFLIGKTVRNDLLYGTITGVCNVGVFVVARWMSFGELREHWEKYNSVLKVWERCEKV